MHLHERLKTKFDLQCIVGCLSLIEAGDAILEFEKRKMNKIVQLQYSQKCIAIEKPNRMVAN